MLEKAVCLVRAHDTIQKTARTTASATVLYKTCFDWLRDAALEAGFGCVVRTLEDCDARYGLVLAPAFPFLSADDMKKSYEIFKSSGAACPIRVRDVTVGYWSNLDSEPVFGDSFYEVETDAPIISDSLSLTRANEYARARILERHLGNGVLIPLTDGVVIGPDAIIAAGANVLSDTVIIGKSVIGENAVVGPASYVQDSEIGADTVFKFSTSLDSRVGARATVGPYTQLRPASEIGDEVKIGDFVEIKNTKIGRGTSVAHLTYLGDADIGRYCNFGCGVVVVNYDGERKCRTVVKDFAFIGCNTNLVSPVTVGEAAFTAAGSTITEDVPDGALGIERAKQVNKEGFGARKLRSYIEKKNAGEKL